MHTFFHCWFLDFLGKAKKILKSDNPFEILEKTHIKSTNQHKQEAVEWNPQDFGMGNSHSKLNEKVS